MTTSEQLHPTRSARMVGKAIVQSYYSHYMHRVQGEIHQRDGHTSLSHGERTPGVVE